ncbi:MAG TPA: class I SAM-dependent methyltransferase [Gemmataceae bacterium]|jgi:SAM-dependent methyltransferase
MPYNLRIPGWMPEHELKLIEQLAAMIPSNGRMVEVGSFLGRSSWCWAKSVAPSVYVYCLDIWNPAEHPYHPPAEIGKKDTQNPDFGVADCLEHLVGSLENFQRFTGDCPNIFPIRGASPYDFQNWSDPLDLVFLDGVHHNPTFWDDLNFWFWKIKPGGILCGHDYARTHPDVIWSVHDFTAARGLMFWVQHRIWAMRRPPDSTLAHANVVEIA